MPGSLQAEMWGKYLMKPIREKVTMPHDPQCQYRANLLHQLLLDDSFADCKIACGSATMKCHRSILAAASPVWRSAFSGNFREAHEATISIQDAELDTVEALVRYAYTGEVDANCVASLLPLAHRYELSKLVGLCAQVMYEEMTPGNGVSYVSLLNTFIQHEEVAAIWPRAVDKVRSNREFNDVLLRSVRHRGV